jgi:CopG family nickel-responsive transcriptional regulator
MVSLVRFGVSIEDELLSKFDKLLKQEGYPTRSEAIKGLITQALVKQEWTGKNNEVAGTITFIYDHHKRDLVNKLIDIQHDFNQLIISVQHIHLDHDNCMEIAVVRGRVKEIQELAAKLKSVKGIKHSDLVMTTIGH